MPLSCSCDYDDFDWYYNHPDDYKIMQALNRRKRCKSCGELISAGEQVAEFECGRPPMNDIEERIYGDDYMSVPLATKYFCEKCSDLYFNFQELGFECAGLGDNMQDLLRDYTAEYSRKKKND